jgi:hypothetical protein
MKLHFADDFDAVFARTLGITRRDVESVAEAPDDLRVLMRAECSIALKKIPARSYEYLLVLIERGQGSKVMAAWPLPFGLIEPGTDPFQALSVLCEKYGSVLEVPGAEPGTLVRDVTFQPIPTRVDEIFQISPSGLRGRPNGQVTQMRVTMDPPRNQMLLSLLYSLDPAVVAQAVRQAKPAR